MTNQTHEALEPWHRGEGSMREKMQEGTIKGYLAYKPLTGNIFVDVTTLTGCVGCYPLGQVMVNHHPSPFFAKDTTAL